METPLPFCIYYLLRDDVFVTWTRPFGITDFLYCECADKEFEHFRSSKNISWNYELSFDTKQLDFVIFRDP